MTTTPHARQSALLAALSHDDSSARLQAALTAGTYPDPAQVEALVARCAVEPDFSVRDMLTWAIIRHPSSVTLPAVLPELDSPLAQARSQALHTLSKIAEPSSWSAIPAGVLHDADDEVARAGWRAAVALVPEAGRAALAEQLATELGRGGLEVQRSLSRAFVELEDVADAALHTASTTGAESVRIHALATLALLADPDSSFAGHLEQAKRAAILRDAPLPGAG
ncbi:HEAT repeat domain-containing protein [Agrococcus baldri]|uniref:HEAT repeat-containing protein n=1 Tax=Agrococcus baldri TaxID=153730 RepID=A0AA87UXB8_9MICO|nr:HEAT repeat domain-containing protein [Agrococcus baldri]GEK80252.1 hypothetical protein ABA31_16030 [Agrococcus baldri]